MAAVGKPGPAGLLDLETELTCSVCTDILYQPLSLLDCLHTFCGSCVKEWFGWQRVRQDQENARSRHRPKPYTLTCPSCRAIVRDARPNATVTTLLDMYLQANPGKSKSAKDKEDIAQSYTQGEDVILKTRELSARNVARHNHETRPRHSNEQSSDSEDDYERVVLERALAESREDMTRRLPVRPPRQAHEHRSTAQPSRTERRRATSTDRRAQEQELREFDRRNARESGSHDGRLADISRERSRRVDLGHQSSLRSIISSSEPDSTEMEQEIMRQIVEEGLLDGIDLDVIGPEEEEEISERIAQAYRRRRREEGRRPSNNASRRRISNESRTSRHSNHETSSSTSVQTRHVRRTSGNHLSPATIDSNQRQSLSSRSATDLLSIQTPETGRERDRRRSLENRRSTEPGTRISDRWHRGAAGISPSEQPTTRQEPSVPLPPTVNEQEAPIPVASDEQATATANRLIDDSEFGVSCNRCGQEHIEYELHFSCDKCGPELNTFDLCRRCYLLGRGCNHWFGFGAETWRQFEKLRSVSEPSATREPPHFLQPQVYLKSNGDNTSALGLRSGPVQGIYLVRGAFCGICQRNANLCYWRCEVCNEGEWGFCNDCVNQARHCTHPLQPFAYGPLVVDDKYQGMAGLWHGLPSDMVPLGQLETTCNVCHSVIDPHERRLHCPMCHDGDFDICFACYIALADAGKIAPRNGLDGWRRCPSGHRMLVIALEGPSRRTPSLRRIMCEQVVGGWALEESVDQSSPGQHTGPNSPSSAAASWRNGDKAHAELRNTNTGEQSPQTNQPHSGLVSVPTGLNTSMTALWTRVPDEGETNELSFPKHAEIAEVKDINEDWCWGVYCRMKGLFPAAYGWAPPVN